MEWVRGQIPLRRGGSPGTYLLRFVAPHGRRGGSGRPMFGFREGRCTGYQEIVSEPVRRIGLNGCRSFQPISPEGPRIPRAGRWCRI